MIDLAKRGSWWSREKEIRKPDRESCADHRIILYELLGFSEKSLETRVNRLCKRVLRETENDGII